MKKFWLYAVAAFLLILPMVMFTQAEEINPEVKKQAVESSLSWLNIVDQGQYEQSWVEADGLFQTLVPKEQWIQQLSGARGSLGGIKTREVYGAGYFGNIPNHPGMEMVVVQFKTSFQNKPLAYETISPVRMNGGPWKISGYYITDSIDTKAQ